MTDLRTRLPVSPEQFAAALLQALFFIAYPLLIYFAHTRFTTRAVGVWVLALYGISFLLRSRGRAGALRPLLKQHLPLAAAIALAIATGDRRLLLLLPVIVSSYLFATFAWSLRVGPPMIERFARLVEDDLPPFTRPYCRRVTLLWCVFLAGNALTVTLLAVAAPLAWWALYTGPTFYLLLALLLAAELCFRKWWFRYYGEGFADRIFAKCFPPEQTEAGRRSLAYVAARVEGSTSPQ
jgi:uncharacterized membrane protein